MSSHKRLTGGLELTAARGTRFKKRASRYNKCIGAEMKGKAHAKLPVGTGGRWDKTFQGYFKAAVAKCK